MDHNFVWILRDAALQAARPASSSGRTCGRRCQQGGIGPEQQDVEPGFQSGEPLVFDPHSLGLVPHPFGFEPQSLRWLLDVLDGSPIQHLQFNIAKQRRQSGNVPRCSDLVIESKGLELEEHGVASVGDERDQISRLPATHVISLWVSGQRLRRSGGSAALLVIKSSMTAATPQARRSGESGL